MNSTHITVFKLASVLPITCSPQRPELSLTAEGSLGEKPCCAAASDVEMGTVVPTSDSAIFALRLNRLFETAHPLGRGPYTSAEVSRACCCAGVRVSTPYISQLRNGIRVRPSGTVQDALARVFGVATRYFTDDDYFRWINAELTLLAKARSGPVRHLVDTLSVLSPLARVELEIFVGALADGNQSESDRRADPRPYGSSGYRIGVSQLRSAVVDYMELAAAGRTIELTRRGTVVARVQPTWRRRSVSSSGVALIVHTKQFRNRAGYYMDRVADGAHLEIIYRGRPIGRIEAVTETSQSLSQRPNRALQKS